MERPAPVVFKKFKPSGFNNNKAEKTLDLTYFYIEYYKPEDSNGYYMLVSNNDSTRPLRLYQSAMESLDRQLENAFTSAFQLSETNPPDNETYDLSLINTYGSMAVRLVMTTFMQKVNIWLRLYTLNEKKESIPTKTGVRFSPNDAEALSKFIAANKQ